MNWLCECFLQDEVVEFPLYTEAIKFAHHEESMVRIAVRTLTLHIYNSMCYFTLWLLYLLRKWSLKTLETKVHMLSVTTTFNIRWGSAVDDEAIRKFIMSPQSVGYFLELVTSLKEQTARLVDFVTESAK